MLTSINSSKCEKNNSHSPLHHHNTVGREEGQTLARVWRSKGVQKCRNTEDMSIQTSIFAQQSIYANKRLGKQGALVSQYSTPCSSRRPSEISSLSLSRLIINNIAVTDGLPISPSDNYILTSRRDSTHYHRKRAKFSATSLFCFKQVSELR